MIFAGKAAAVHRSLDPQGSFAVRYPVNELRSRLNYQHHMIVSLTTPIAAFDKDQG